MIKHLHFKQQITQPFVKSVPIRYRKASAENYLYILDNKLFCYQDIAILLKRIIILSLYD